MIVDVHAHYGFIAGTQGLDYESGTRVKSERMNGGFRVVVAVRFDIDNTLADRMEPVDGAVVSGVLVRTIQILVQPVYLVLRLFVTRYIKRRFLQEKAVFEKGSVKISPTKV